MHTLAKTSEALALEVICNEDELTVVLDDGRTVSVPLAWFPRLQHATPGQRRKWELIGGGIGIHWEVIDEDISVDSLLRPEKFMRMAGPMGVAARTRTESRPARSAGGRHARQRG